MNPPTPSGLSSEQYRQLKQIALFRLRGQGPGATLNCTALVHEAFIKLQNSATDAPIDENHYFALASLAMRQIIVDHVRRKHANKRGGDEVHVTLQESVVGDADRTVDLIELDEALTRLGDLDAELEQLVVMRFFGGLSMTEAAEAMGKSKRTLERDWARARMHLYRDLTWDDH
jgi:RNA polymerase sigma factor (TIGR02999 family)